MSRYTSLCTAIEMMSVTKRVIAGDQDGEEKVSAVIEDLQAIAKDVRYGGAWDGNYETVAEALNCCVMRECSVCAYQKLKSGKPCAQELKKDAAAAIRQMAKDLKELRG